MEILIVIGIFLITVAVTAFFLKRSKDCLVIMRKYYKKMLSCFSNSCFRSSAEYELIPLLYVLGDLTLVAQQKDRSKYARQVAPHGLPEILTEKDDDEFRLRLDFYAHVVQSGYVWGQWSVVELPQDIKQNPLSRCLVACGDLIMDAGCVDDYENAPVSLYDSFEILALNKIMYKLSDLAFSYCKAIDRAL